MGTYHFFAYYYYIARCIYLYQKYKIMVNNVMWYVLNVCIIVLLLVVFFTLKDSLKSNEEVAVKISSISDSLSKLDIKCTIEE